MKKGGGNSRRKDSREKNQCGSDDEKGDDRSVADKEGMLAMGPRYLFRFGDEKKSSVFGAYFWLSSLISVAMASVTRLLVHNFCLDFHWRLSSSSSLFGRPTSAILGLGSARLPLPKTVSGSSHRNLINFKSSAANEGVVPFEDDPEDGVSLGTVKLPPNTDIATFEVLLFQWANSLCQGANLPFPVPLKVDKVRGGVRLGFIRIGDGKTEVPVYIDCLVFPATDSSGPIFRAIRNGLLKDKPPPGEPRIMRSLLPALKKSIEIAGV